MSKSQPRQGASRLVACACLFVDINGVLLSNGWDHVARRRTAKHFGVPSPEIEERHHLMFGSYEVVKNTLDAYLDQVIFHHKRPFTRAHFRRYMFAQSRPFLEMLDLIARLKAKYCLKVVEVSNEGNELNAHQIRMFNLTNLIDCFVSSCFIGIRKPDAEIFRIALDLAQVLPHQMVFIENTAMFVEIAESHRLCNHKHLRASLPRHASAWIRGIDYSWDEQSLKRTTLMNGSISQGEWAWLS